MEEGRQKKQIGAKKLLPHRFSPFSAQHFLQYKYLPLFVWTMPIRTSLASLVWVAEYYIELHLNVEERGDRTPLQCEQGRSMDGMVGAEQELAMATLASVKSCQ